MSVEVVAVAVATITQQGLPLMVGICCDQPFNALAGDKVAPTNVYVNVPLGKDGELSPRWNNNIVALFNPS